VLVNRGDGTFETKRDYPTGDRPDSVAIGDLDSDGKPDLAIANNLSSTV
jgi:FG-GAP-like repeat